MSELPNPNEVLSTGFICPSCGHSQAITVIPSQAQVVAKDLIMVTDSCGICKAGLSITLNTISAEITSVKPTN